MFEGSQRVTPFVLLRRDSACASGARFPLEVKSVPLRNLSVFSYASSLRHGLRFSKPWKPDMVDKHLESADSIYMILTAAIIIIIDSSQVGSG